MRPYTSRRLTEVPDKGDLHAEGRASAVGGGRPGTRRPAPKAATRRYLKRADRARALRTARDDS